MKLIIYLTKYKFFCVLALLFMVPLDPILFPRRTGFWKHFWSDIKAAWKEFKVDAKEIYQLT